MIHLPPQSHIYTRVRARHISIGEFLREGSRSFSPESKRASIPQSVFATAEPEAPVPTYSLRTRPSLYAIDRYLLDNELRYTEHLYPWEPDIWSTSETAVTARGGREYSDQVTVDITSRYYERTRNRDTPIYFSSSLFSKKKKKKKTKHESFPVTLPYARNVISLWISPRVVFSRHPLRVRATRFYSEIAPNILPGRITPRPKYIFPCLRSVRKSLSKKYSPDFGIIKIFLFTLPKL